MSSKIEMTSGFFKNQEFQSHHKSILKRHKCSEYEPMYMDMDEHIIHQKSE